MLFVKTNVVLNHFCPPFLFEEFSTKKKLQVKREELEGSQEHSDVPALALGCTSRAREEDAHSTLVLPRASHGGVA